MAKPAQFRTRRDGRVYVKGEADLNEFINKIDRAAKAGAKRSGEFPKVIVFDWNGTVDARGVGIGIPADVILSLRKLGKTVIIYTSSVKADRKIFMRKWCEQYGIPYTDNEKILDSADLFIGDKHSDEKRAGKHGVNFVYTDDFEMSKVIPKFTKKAGIIGENEIHSGAGSEIGCAECVGKIKASHVDKSLAEIGAHEATEVNTALPIDRRIVEEVRSYNHEYGGASIGDIVYEINTRGKDLINQGAVDVYAHMDQDAIQAQVDKLVSEGRLKAVKRYEDSKPTYYHVHVG